MERDTKVLTESQESNAGRIHNFVKNMDLTEEERSVVASNMIKTSINLGLHEAKEDCKSCFGRGFIGYNPVHSHAIPCPKRCFVKEEDKKKGN